MTRLAGPVSRCAVVVVGVLVVSACASSRGVGVGSVLGYDGLQHDIRRFYASHAWERGAVCNTPEITTIRSAEIVEETADTIIANVRYTWLDEANNDSSSRTVRYRGSGSTCRGIDERQFTLEKVPDGVRVVAMNGAQRRR